MEIDRKSESLRPGSVSSSDLSDSSSVRRKSSAPKVAAVIIVSLALVAVLVGLTIYLIDIEKEKQLIERVERLEEGIEVEMDFGENANAYRAEEVEMTEVAVEAEPPLAVKTADIYENLQQRQLSKEQVEHLKNIGQRRRFLENFKKSQQEDFLRPSAAEREIISRVIANRQPSAGGAGRREKPISRPASPDLEFGGVGLFGKTEIEPAAAEPALHQNHRPAKPRLQQEDQSAGQVELGREGVADRDIYDMTEFAGPPPARRRNFRQRPRVLRPGLEGLRRAGEAGPLTGEPGLATIDRRPGRPTFHHQGPLGSQSGPGPGRGLARRRFRQQPGRAGPRPDQVATETELRQEMAEMAERKQEEILSNFDSFLKLAGSEMGSLREVARNITSSGKELNLWEILAAVNQTVRQSPDSSIAQLMTKFEDRYIAAAPTEAKPAQAVYERSLSSLLFLSMGIFLLNSVNELVDSGRLPAGARSIDTHHTLASLAADSTRHREVFQLFNSSAFDFFAHEGGEGVLEALRPDNPASTVNNYVRLAMNLMNAYMRDSGEFECIYAAYCWELNQQARLEGMASSVARINSVGLRLALKELDSDATVPALMRSLWAWDDLPCLTMFPTCDLGLTKVEHS